MKVITAALLGIIVNACIWWSYFDWVAYVAQSRLAEATGSARAALARDAYSYLHLPMVAGIVLFAFGLKATLAHSTSSLPNIPALGMTGGIALYLLAHVLLRLRLGSGLGRGRPVAVAVLIGLFPVIRSVSGLTALTVVASVCVSLIAYEFFRHREERASIRGSSRATRQRSPS
jgi:low temperature requirement protein LtrA